MVVFDRRVEMSKRLSGPVEIEQRDAEAVVDARLAGIDRERLLKQRDRLRRPLQRGETKAGVIERIGAVGRELPDQIETGQRFVSADSPIDVIVGDGEARSADVVVGQVRQRLSKLRPPRRAGLCAIAQGFVRQVLPCGEQDRAGAG